MAQCRGSPFQRRLCNAGIQSGPQCWAPRRCTDVRRRDRHSSLSTRRRCTGPGPGSPGVTLPLSGQDPPSAAQPPLPEPPRCTRGVLKVRPRCSRSGWTKRGGQVLPRCTRSHAPGRGRGQGHGGGTMGRCRGPGGRRGRRGSGRDTGGVPCNWRGEHTRPLSPWCRCTPLAGVYSCGAVVAGAGDNQPTGNWQHPEQYEKQYCIWYWEEQYHTQ